MEGWSSEDEAPLGKVADFLKASERARREGQLQRKMQTKETKERKRRLREQPTEGEFKEYDEEIAQLEKRIAKKFSPPIFTPNIIRRKEEPLIRYRQETRLRKNLKNAIDDMDDSRLAQFSKIISDSPFTSRYIEIDPEGIPYLEIDKIPIHIVKNLIWVTNGGLMTDRINFINYMDAYFNKFPQHLDLVKQFMRKLGAPFDDNDELIMNESFNEAIIPTTVGYMRSLMKK